jgi:ERCC4-type nuclease
MICIDSREQAPFSFCGIEGEGRDAGRPVIVETKVVGLRTGDYSIEGFEDKVCCERKSISDYFGSIGSGRERFEREMDRMSRMEFAAVIIEGDWRELLIDKPSNTQIPGKVASRTIASWSVRFGVHHFPMMSRRHAELFTFQLLSMYWRQLERRHESLIESAAESINLSSQE